VCAAAADRAALSSRRSALGDNQTNAGALLTAARQRRRVTRACERGILAGATCSDRARIAANCCTRGASCSLVTCARAGVCAAGSRWRRAQRWEGRSKLSASSRISARSGCAVHSLDAPSSSFAQQAARAEACCRVEPRCCRAERLLAAASRCVCASHGRRAPCRRRSGCGLRRRPRRAGCTPRRRLLRSWRHRRLLSACVLAQLRTAALESRRPRRLMLPTSRRQSPSRLSGCAAAATALQAALNPIRTLLTPPARTACASRLLRSWPRTWRRSACQRRRPSRRALRPARRCGWPKQLQKARAVFVAALTRVSPAGCRAADADCG
jgi:hypothetical protein